MSFTRSVTLQLSVSSLTQYSFLIDVSLVLWEKNNDSHVTFDWVSMQLQGIPVNIVDVIHKPERFGKVDLYIWIREIMMKKLSYRGLVPERAVLKTPAQKAVLLSANDTHTKCQDPAYLLKRNVNKFVVWDKLTYMSYKLN